MKKGSAYTPYLFAFLSLLLLGLAGWVIWKDEVQLRPWKAYQQEYKELKGAKLQAEYDVAKKEFDSNGNAEKLEALQARLQAAKEIFQSRKVQEKYTGLVGQLDIIEASLAQNQKKLQETRGKYLEAEYLYIRGQKEQDKEVMQQLQGEIEGLTENRNVLLERKSALQEDIGELTNESEAIRAEIRSLHKGLGEKLTAIESNDRMSLEIRQIHIRDAGKADRCITCHAGIESSYRLSDRQPLTRHPAGFIFLENHPVSEYGCTFCHQGQGRATTSPDKAHGWVDHWTEPMHQGSMTQSSCISCHGDIEGLRGAEFISKGSKLIKKYGCYGCHMIPGYEDLREVGPVLAEVGTKINYSWAVNWLQDPKTYYETARMPKFYLSKEEAESIADYLFSMTGTTRRDTLYADEDIDWDLAEKGKAIWRQSRCNICHTTNGKGGNHTEIHAPDLSKVGSKVTREWLFNWIKDPKKYFPETKMPRYRFSDQELAALVEYIVSEFQDWDFEPEYGDPVPMKAESIEKGKALVQKYGCFGCHKVKGMEEMQDIAPQLRRAGVTFAGSGELEEKIGAELSSIGSKPVELLDFGKMKGKIPHDRLSYVKQKLRAPRSFRDDLRMPDYRLGEEELGSISSVLLGFTDASRPARFVVPSYAEIEGLEGETDSHILSGDFEKLERDIKCLNCHKIGNHGYNYAPDLSVAGSKLQEEWLRRFLKQPDIIRPMLKQMPRFNLDKQDGMIQGNLESSEIETVMNFFRSDLVTDDIPAFLPSLDDGAVDQVLEGKRLYDEKGCVACHQIGNAGGSVGPNLSNVGGRLTAGFMFKYLEDPQRYNPRNVEPKYGFTERERIYLARYLMSLKLE